MNTIDIACFEVNEHGRLLSGNRRFCRMFGFEPSELPWHYVTDLYRYISDWEKFRHDTQNASFTTRMKNRRGRSFDCCIVREIFQNEDGEVIFRNTIHKIGEGKGVVTQTVPLSVVFLAKCSDCLKPGSVCSATVARPRRSRKRSTAKRPRYKARRPFVSHKRLGASEPCCRKRAIFKRGIGEQGRRKGKGGEGGKENKKRKAVRKNRFSTYLRRKNYTPKASSAAPET